MIKQTTLVYKSICLGKTANGSNSGRKIYEVNIGLELTYRETGAPYRTIEGRTALDVVSLSICGEIWNSKHSDIISGGQNIDHIANLAEFKDNKTIQRIRQIWERWHLNCLRAGCIHQQGWDKSRIGHNCPECGYRYGSAWLVEQLPVDIVNEICDLFGVEASVKAVAVEHAQKCLDNQFALLP